MGRNGENIFTKTQYNSKIKETHYMEQSKSTINETIVQGRKFRRLVDPVAKNWIRTDPTWIAEKYRMNSLMEFKPIDKSKITFRKRIVMEDSLIITEFYKNFEGRIITTESVIHDDTEEKIYVEWDCGATRCSISKELADKLNLKP